MSKAFINAIGFLLFLGVMMAAVYLIGDFIEDARGAISHARLL